MNLHATSRLLEIFRQKKLKPEQAKWINLKNNKRLAVTDREAADKYIEKTVHAMGRKHRVTVATSDGLEQVIIVHW